MTGRKTLRRSRPQRCSCLVTPMPSVLAHAVQFFELLGGGKKDGGWDGSGISNTRLAILPGLTHYNIFSSPALASTVTPFVDAPTPGAK
jgi:hypothetical protein